MGDRPVATDVSDLGARPIAARVGATGRAVAAAGIAAVLLSACSPPAGDPSTPATAMSASTGQAAPDGMSESTAPDAVAPTPSLQSVSPSVLPSVAASAAVASPSPPATGNGLVATLCQARQAADDGESAAEAFAGAHDGLHQAARDLQDAGERVVAGDLLEAKQRVEAVVGDRPPADDLPDRLSALIDATTRAMTVLGDAPGSCN